MEKKPYESLRLSFVFFEKQDIVTASIGIYDSECGKDVVIGDIFDH